MSSARGLRAGRILFHLLASAIAGLCLVPLLWVLAFSLRTPGLPPPVGIEWLPWPLAWGNYATIFELVPLGRYIGNSLVVVALAVPLTIVTAGLAGFGMAQQPERTRQRLLVLAVLLLMVPVTSLWVTRYLIFSLVGLLDTVWALIVTAFMGSTPFYVLLFYWTFRRIPSELFDAARVDGAGAFTSWALVAMPLARPTIVAVGVLAFSLYWGDFLSPLIYLKSDSRYTLPVGLSLLKQLDSTNLPLLLAGAVVMTAPVIGLFLLVQRYFWPEGRLSGLAGR